MREFTWKPMIEVETNQGCREIDLYTHNLMNRRVFLTCDIDSVSVNHILTQLLYLKSVSDEPINMYINSVGGCVNDGLILYDVITSLKVTIDMYCIGCAASMAAIIFASGEKGHRFILPHSKTMIHEPLIMSTVGGSASSIHDISNSVLETKNICNELLSKHTGKPLDLINRITTHDHYMNAQESIDFGICDAICTELP